MSADYRLIKFESKIFIFSLYNYFYLQKHNYKISRIYEKDTNNVNLLLLFKLIKCKHWNEAIPRPSRNSIPGEPKLWLFTFFLRRPLLTERWICLFLRREFWSHLLQFWLPPGLKQSPFLTHLYNLEINPLVTTRYILTFAKNWTFKDKPQIQGEKKEVGQLYGDSSRVLSSPTFIT